MKKGKWVFVEEDEQPRHYFSFAPALIYCRLAFRVPDRDIDFCIKRNISPPKHLKPSQLKCWIDGAKCLDSRFVKFV